MNKRNKWLRLVIQHTPLFWRVPRELRLRVWMRLAINQELGFAYIRIPKAANSTVAKTLALRAYPGQRTTIEADPRGSEAKNLFQSISPLRCPTRRCLQRRYYTFTFVRHPYTRLLSAYLDKVTSDYSQQKKGWERRSSHWSVDQGTSFEAFVTSLEQGNLCANIHWAPQTIICPVALRDLDFVGRVENLEHDLTTVTERLFGTTALELIGQREHNRQNANDKLDQYYTPALRKRVFRLYREDFEQLGYDP